MVYVPGSFAVVVLRSIEIRPSRSFKIRWGCVPPGGFVLCFDCSAWANLFYGFTA